MSSLSQTEIIKQRILARKQATIAPPQETSSPVLPISDLPKENAPVPLETQNGSLGHDQGNEDRKPADAQNNHGIYSTSSQQPIQNHKMLNKSAELIDAEQNKEKKEDSRSEKIESELQYSESCAEREIEEEIEDIEEEEVEPDMMQEESENAFEQGRETIPKSERVFGRIDEDDIKSLQAKSTDQAFGKADYSDASEHPSLNEQAQHIDQEIADDDRSQLKNQSDRKVSEAQSKLELTDLQQDYVFEDDVELSENKSKIRQEEEVYLGKKPNPSATNTRPAEQKVFKIKTRTYYHDCGKLGLKCPDFTLLQSLFESISKLRLLDSTDLFTPSEEMVTRTRELKEIMERLISSDSLSELYTSEIIYVIKSLLGFNNNRANQAIVCLAASMLHIQALKSEALSELIHILTSSSFFDTSIGRSLSVFDIKNPGFAKALVISYAKENEDIRSQSKLELIARLLSHRENLSEVVGYLGSLPKHELVAEKLIHVFESITNVVFGSDLDYDFLLRFVKISLTPNARLRYKGLQLIRDYLRNKNVDSIVSQDEFKSLAICLFVNKVYHSSNKSLNPEEFVKALWALVGKSHIRDMLFDYPEDFLLEYARLSQECTAFLKAANEQLSPAEKEDVYDFQVSLLIAVTEIHRTSLTEDTLPQAIPIILGFINELFDCANPRIELNRLVKFLNHILEDFRKPDVVDTELDCFRFLTKLIQTRIGLFLQADCISQFEATISSLHKPVFNNIRHQIDFYGLLHNLSKTDQDLLTLLIYENISEDDEMNEQIESRVLEVAESLIDQSVMTSPLFASIKRLVNSAKFKRLVAHVIKANLGELAANLDTNTEAVSELINWCKEPLLEVLEQMASGEESEEYKEQVKKIQTLLTNFNQC